jgi:hypothetical protein
MKPASSATLAIMAAGQMKRIDLYAITLAGGSPTYYFTSHQTPWWSAANSIRRG